MGPALDDRAALPPVRGRGLPPVRSPPAAAAAPPVRPGRGGRGGRGRAGPPGRRAPRGLGRRRLRALLAGRRDAQLDDDREPAHAAVRRGRWPLLAREAAEPSRRRGVRWAACSRPLRAGPLGLHRLRCAWPRCVAASGRRGRRGRLAPPALVGRGRAPRSSCPGPRATCSWSATPCSSRAPPSRTSGARTTSRDRRALPAAGGGGPRPAHAGGQARGRPALRPARDPPAPGRFVAEGARRTSGTSSGPRACRTCSASSGRWSRGGTPARCCSTTCRSSLAIPLFAGLPVRRPALARARPDRALDRPTTCSWSWSCSTTRSATAARSCRSASPAPLAGLAPARSGGRGAAAGSSHWVALALGARGVAVGRCGPYRVARRGARLAARPAHPARRGAAARGDVAEAARHAADAAARNPRSARPVVRPGQGPACGPGVRRRPRRGLRARGRAGELRELAPGPRAARGPPRHRPAEDAAPPARSASTASPGTPTRGSCWRSAWRELPPPRTDEVLLARGDYGAVRGFLHPRGLDPALLRPPPRVEPLRPHGRPAAAPGAAPLEPRPRVDAPGAHAAGLRVRGHDPDGRAVPLNAALARGRGARGRRGDPTGGRGRQRAAVPVPGCGPAGAAAAGGPRRLRPGAAPASPRTRACAWTACRSAPWTDRPSVSARSSRDHAAATRGSYIPAALTSRGGPHAARVAPFSAHPCGGPPMMSRRFSSFRVLAVVALAWSAVPAPVRAVHLRRGGRTVTDATKAVLPGPP